MIPSQQLLHQPHQVRLIELPGAVLAREQAALQPIGEATDHPLQMAELLVEDWGFSADTLERLKEAGYKVNARGGIGECQAIAIDPETRWRFGAADPRGDGKAVGY